MTAIMPLHGVRFVDAVQWSRLPLGYLFEVNALLIGPLLARLLALPPDYSQRQVAAKSSCLHEAPLGSVQSAYVEIQPPMSSDLIES